MASQENLRNKGETWDSELMGRYTSQDETHVMLYEQRLQHQHVLAEVSTGMWECGRGSSVADRQYDISCTQYTQSILHRQHWTASSCKYRQQKYYISHSLQACAKLSTAETEDWSFTQTETFILCLTLVIIWSLLCACHTSASATVGISDHRETSVGARWVSQKYRNLLAHSRRIRHVPCILTQEFFLILSAQSEGEWSCAGKYEVNKIHVPKRMIKA